MLSASEPPKFPSVPTLAPGAWRGMGGGGGMEVGCERQEYWNELAENRMISFLPTMNTDAYFFPHFFTFFHKKL